MPSVYWKTQKRSSINEKKKMFIVSFTRVRVGRSVCRPQASLRQALYVTEEAVSLPSGNQDLSPAAVHRAQPPPAEQPTCQGTGGWERTQTVMPLEFTAQGSKLSAK